MSYSTLVVFLLAGELIKLFFLEFFYLLVATIKVIELKIFTDRSKLFF